MVCNVQSADGVTRSHVEIVKTVADPPCDRCKALEANDHENIEYFVSLLDQLDEMWMKGKSAKAKELEGAVSRARRATVQARTYLIMHRANHRQDPYTSSTYRRNTKRQRGIRSIMARNYTRAKTTNSPPPPPQSRAIATSVFFVLPRFRYPRFAAENRAATNRARKGGYALNINGQRYLRLTWLSERTPAPWVSLVLSLRSPLVATAMACSDDRALGRVPAHGSDSGTLCRTASFRMWTL